MIIYFLCKNFTENQKKSRKKTYSDSAALNQNWGSLQKSSKWYIFDAPIGKQGGSPSSIMQVPLIINSIIKF